MPQLIRVKVIGENRVSTVVEYLGQKYIVKSSNLSNHVRTQVEGGFVNYAYINEIFLVRKWQ